MRGWYGLSNPVTRLQGDIFESELERYGKNKATVVNKSYINSNEYRRKFDSITDNPGVNRVLYQKAKEMLFHRSGTLYEDMYWIDGNNGKILKSITDSKEKQEIKYNSYSVKKLGDNVITIHNHPESLPPSPSDYNSNKNNNYTLGVVVCHNGKLYIYSSGKTYNKLLHAMKIEKHNKICYNIEKAQHDAINELKNDEYISFMEV